MVVWWGKEGREMTAMRSARAAGLALAMLAASAAAALAQSTPWPTDPPQRAPAQAPWPSAAPQQAPAQTPWPAAAQPSQPMAMPAPSGPMMGGGMMGGGPTAAQQACIQEFGKFREEVEKRAMAAKAGSEKKVPREEMCTLVTAYSAAETKWIKFSEDNMTKCGIPKEAVNQIKGVHVHTADARKKICASGPQAGAPAAPSLSDALGTSRLPASAAEKPKAGGMLDTLTGNALAR
jgi:hypothetical protein